MTRVTLPPQLTVACVTCGVGAGEWCVSRNAVRIHASRYQALDSLESAADKLLAGDSGRSGAQTSRVGSGGRKKRKGRRPYPVKGRMTTGPGYVAGSGTDASPFSQAG